MKYSEAMLKGYKRVQGRQSLCGPVVFAGTKSEAICALVAVNEGFGNTTTEAAKFNSLMARAWGRSVITLNDIDKLPWEHIYGMAVAADL